MKQYECIKSFVVPKCDGGGFETDEHIITKVGTVWYIPEDEDYRFVGGEVRLESDDLGWLEISNNTFEDCFKEVVLSKPVNKHKPGRELYTCPKCGKQIWLQSNILATYEKRGCCLDCFKVPATPREVR